jgi:hypothetical protein
LQGGRERIFPGIGVTAAESRLDAVQAVDQVSAAREAGAPGFVLYGLTRALETEILPVVKQAFPPPARAAAVEPAEP